MRDPLRRKRLTAELGLSALDSEGPTVPLGFGSPAAIGNLLLEIFSADTHGLSAGALETSAWKITDQVSIFYAGRVVESGTRGDLLRQAVG